MRIDTETSIRRYLWLTHGHHGIYGDDGEMQCIECLVFGASDYKREPLDTVVNAATQAKEATGLAQLAESKRLSDSRDAAVKRGEELSKVASAALGVVKEWDESGEASELIADVEARMAVLRATLTDEILNGIEARAALASHRDGGNRD